MVTVVYLIRHAERLSRNIFSSYNADDNSLLKNEKQLISIDGEKKAECLARMEFLQNVSIIYSSHYVRTISTAKYLAEHLNLQINVDARFGEREHGDMSKVVPDVYYYNQYHDFNYKAPLGESINETKNRYIEAFDEVVNNNLGREIAIFTHGIALMSFLTNYCEVGYNLENNIVLTYKNENFSNIWNAPDVVKVTLEDREVVNIERLELEF